MVLELKNIEYEYRAIHLVKDGGEQKKNDYKEINPMQQVFILLILIYNDCVMFWNKYVQVPALIFDGNTITQSMAIMEFLEETYPKVKILPGDALTKAKVSILFLD